MTAPDAAAVRWARAARVEDVQNLRERLYRVLRDRREGKRPRGAGPPHRVHLKGASPGDLVGPIYGYQYDYERLTGDLGEGSWVQKVNRKTARIGWITSWNGAVNSTLMELSHSVPVTHAFHPVPYGEPDYACGACDGTGVIERGERFTDCHCGPRCWAPERTP